MSQTHTGFFRICVLIVAVALPVGAAEPPAVPANPPPDEVIFRAKCEGLRVADFSQVTDAPTKVMEALWIGATGEIPTSCLLRGHVAPQVGFEMKLPATGWNGKLLEVGSGGYAGSTQVTGEQQFCDDAVRRGYACIHSDHGHTSGITDKAAAALDGLWAYNNPQAEVDYAYRALHVVALAAKAISAQYYGAPSSRAYFMGCSGGGRQALVAAQRFPWDFDGIIAMEPGINFSGLFMTFLYNLRVTTDAEGKLLFAPADLDLMHKAAVAECDMDDGVADGVIGNPPACKFDPARLACAAGAADACLSEAQVTAAQKVYAGPVNSEGKKLFPGRTMPGAERGTFGFGAARPVAAAAIADFFRYMAFVPDAGPGWKLTDFDFDADYKRLGLMESLYAATNPDLRQFKEAGGKLMLVQGWDDGGSALPLNTIDYYEMVQKAMGGRKHTEEFARLFMMPGREHCAGGDGASVADFLGHLEAWVERDTAPDLIKASRIERSLNAADGVREPTDASKIIFTRPIYPYPIRAKYKGSGDPKDYRSFKPVKE